MPIFQALEKTRHPARDGPSAVFPVFHGIVADAQSFGQGIAGAKSQGQTLGFQLFGSHGVFHLGLPFFEYSGQGVMKPAGLRSWYHENAGWADFSGHSHDSFLSLILALFALNMGIC